MNNIIKFLKRVRRSLYYEIRSFIRLRKRVHIKKENKGRNISIKQWLIALKTWGYTGSLYIRFYTAQTGHFDINYIPDNFYEWKITPKLNPRAERRFISDKTLLDVYFPGFTPTLASKIGNNWYKEGNIIAEKEVYKAIRDCYRYGVVVKTARGSQGSGVKIFGAEELEDAIKFIDKSDNINVQRYVQQINELSKFHPSSVNTLRPITLFYKGKVHFLSSLVRFGRRGSKLDNVEAGGLALVLKKDGSSYGAAIDKYYNRYSEHPDTKVGFTDFNYPNWDEAVKFVLYLHSLIPKVGIVGWDIAITCDRFWLIECNVNSPAIIFRQIFDGPLLKSQLPAIYKDVVGKEFQL